MMEQTLYRKYRPDRFAELSGQEHIKKLFGNSLTEEKFSHAYIFAGPRGTGKTTVARIVAKRLNCLNPKNNEPCNECEQCLSITNGSHLDVIEMDAASNRGIDDFRAIRDKVAYKPAQGKYKIYIIDEVHMLTNEAFNAILKTLEEPPEHAVFILATTNPEKIPDTILSRCQIIPFRNLTRTDIKEHLTKISKYEGYDIEEDVFQYIAKRAKGGMRDAMVLLEQVMRFLPKDEVIKKAIVLSVLGGVDEDRFDNFISLIKNNAVEEIISFSDSLYDDGINFGVFLDGLTDYILETLFKIDNSIEKKINLKIAKKSTDLSREIRYSDTPNIVFSVDFIDFADSLVDKNKVQEVSRKIHPDLQLKKQESVPVEYTKSEVSFPDFADENLFLEFSENELDLFLALKFLKTETNDNNFIVFMDHNRPFSNLVIEKKEKFLRDFLEKRELKLLVKKNEEVVKGEAKNLETQKETKDIPSDLVEIYNKVKKLFPESQITIKDN
jgi:DNA polymerase-3 subunit gamma/tau